MSKKLLSVGVALALVATVLVGVGAQTASADAAQCSLVTTLINAGLIPADKVATAKAAAGCDAAMSSSYTFTRDLTVGSTGADVTALQNKLGVTPATGYFGAITKAAVVAYQAANGITPTSGFVGPITRAKLNYVAPVVVPATPATPSTSLEGTSGEIADVTKISTYNNEEVGESESDVKVLGAEIDASKDGDIGLKSVKLEFISSGSNQSTRITDYIDSVNIVLGSKTVATVDASDFNKDSTGDYTKTITLDNAVVLADETAKLYVTVDAVNTFDSGDIANTDWNLTLVNVRYVDGSGVVTTEDAAGDLAITVPVDFVSFSTSADTKFKISLDSSSPKADVVVVDDEDTTDGIVLLKGQILVDGNSDVVLNELPITLVNSSSTGSLSAITGNLILTIDGDDYSESVNATTSSATTTFDNLDLTLTAGKTYKFTVSADINNIDTGFDAGDALTASLTATNREYIDVENEQGDQLASSEKSGAALGKAQTFYVSGINVKVNSASGVVTSNDGPANDSVTYTVSFTVSAFGDAIYISSATTTDSEYLYTGTAPTVNESRISASDTDSLDAGSPSYDYFYVADGDSRTFTYTSILTATGTASTISNFKLSDIGWGLDPASIESYTGNLDASAVPASKLLN